MDGIHAGNCYYLYTSTYLCVMSKGGIVIWSSSGHP